MSESIISSCLHKPYYLRDDPIVYSYNTPHNNVVPKLAQLAENAVISMVINGPACKNGGSLLGEQQIFYHTNVEYIPCTSQPPHKKPRWRAEIYLHDSPPAEGYSSMELEAIRVLNSAPDLYFKVVDAIIIGEFVRDLYTFSIHNTLNIEILAL